MLSFPPALQLTVWINEKMLTAQDTSYDEARNLHSKWLKHQAFMAELASNKDWLNKVDQVSESSETGVVFTLMHVVKRKVPYSQR